MFSSEEFVYSAWKFGPQVKWGSCSRHSIRWSPMSDALIWLPPPECGGNLFASNQWQRRWNSNAINMFSCIRLWLSRLERNSPTDFNSSEVVTYLYFSIYLLVIYVFLPVKCLFMTCSYFLLSYVFLTNLYCFFFFFKLWDIYFSLLLGCMYCKIISQFVGFFFFTLFLASFDAKKLLIFTRPNPSVFL